MNNFSNNKQGNKQRPTVQNSPRGVSGRQPVQRLGDRRRPPEQRSTPRNSRTPQSVRQHVLPVDQERSHIVSRRKNGSRLSKVVAVWVAVLAVFLAVILVFAFAGRDIGNDPDENLPAGVNVNDGLDTSVITTEVPETYPVNYAEYDDDTTGFSSSLTFANGILIDIENGTVVASRGGDQRIYPASMTKVMTLIVAAENAKDLDETFTMTAEITDPLYLANASVAGFAVGEKVTVRDLIYALILPSGGDGALGLAYHIAGSEEAFADMMNDKVKELGLKNTHFTNCTGLHDEDHYSTCHEIAMILEYAIQDEFMREVLSTYKYTTEATPEHPEGIEIFSTLLSRMSGDESGTMFVQGGKTGYTTEAKNCLASFATELIPGITEDELKMQKTKYILVTAGSTDKWGPVFDAIEIYKSFADDTEANGTDNGTVVDVADAVAPAVTDFPETTADTLSDTAEESASDSNEIKIYTAAAPN